MRLRDLGKYMGGLLLAGVLLWWVLRGTDLGQVWEQIRQASLVGILAAIVLNLGHNVFRVWRWRVLLTPIRRDVPFRPMLVAVIVGYMTSWVVPGRLGEVVRPMLLSSREDLPLGPTLGSIVADRMLDGIAVVALFVVGSWLTPLQGEAAEYETVIRTGALTMAAIVAALAVAMLVAASAGERFQNWLSRRPAAVRWIGRMVISVSSGVKALRSPRLALLLAFYSALAWLTIAAATWIGVRSTGADVSFGAILVIQPLLVLGVAVPTPGGAGSYDGAMKLGLMLFGISEVVAVSAAIVMHVLIVVPVVALGMVLLWTDRVSWRDLVKSAAQVRELGTADPTRVAEEVT